MKNLFILVSVVIRIEKAAVKAVADELMSERTSNALTGLVEDIFRGVEESGIKAEVADLKKVIEEVDEAGKKWATTVQESLTKVKHTVWDVKRAQA